MGCVLINRLVHLYRFVEIYIFYQTLATSDTVLDYRAVAALSTLETGVTQKNILFNRLKYCTLLYDRTSDLSLSQTGMQQAICFIPY